MMAETGSSSAGPEERSNRFPSWLVVLAAFLGAVVGVIAARLVVGEIAARLGSFGFAEKTVWDYLNVFLVPALVAAATVWLTWEQSRRQRKDAKAQDDRALAVENERAQDEALQAYLDHIGQLLLDKDRPLRQAEEDAEERTLARARTLTVLPRLDGVRKGSVVQFLYEADLIARGYAILDLSGADLNGANLRGVALIGAKLRRANLIWAALSRADLSGADLSVADLREAKLYEAVLRGATLRDARLSGAKLRGGDLSREEPILRRGEPVIVHVAADLSGANLYEADLSEANLRGAKLRAATLREPS